VAHDYAKKIAKENNFENPVTDWRKINHPYGIPRRPDLTYKDKGWLDWWHFTGIKKYELTLDQILEAQKNTNSAKATAELLGVTISIYEKCSKHYNVYKKMSNSDRNKKIASLRKSSGALKGFKDHLVVEYHLAKKRISKLKLKNHDEYYDAHDEGKIPKGIPKTPDQVYKRLGSWIGWVDFLGKKNKHNIN
jgi:hypothetical protein